MSEMKKILIVNRKYTDNLGDRAIGAALVQLFVKKGCQVYHVEYSSFGKDIASFGPDETSMTSGAGTKASKSPKLLRNFKRFLALNFPKAVWFYGSGRRVLRQIRAIPKDEIDLIVIGGGQLIQSEEDNDKFAYAFRLWDWLNRHLFKTKMAVLGVGAKEGFSPYAAKAFKNGLSRADLIYVRDHHSQKVIEQLACGLDVKIMPDPAFSLSADLPGQQAAETEEKLALVGIYDYDTYCKIHSLQVARSGYYQEWQSKIEALSAAGFSVRLFYSTGTDKLETQQFSEYLGGKYELAAVNSLDDLFALLNSADYVYSGRMHALILALLSGCQVEAFITNTKLKVFAETYLEQSPDLEALRQEIEQAIDTVLASLSGS